MTVVKEIRTAVPTLDDATLDSVVARETVLVCVTRTDGEIDGRILAQLQEVLEGRVSVRRAPLQTCPRSAIRLGVVMTPAYLLFSRGEKRAVAVGSLNPADLKECIDRALR